MEAMDSLVNIGATMSDVENVWEGKNGNQDAADVSKVADGGSPDGGEEGTPRVKSFEPRRYQVMIYEVALRRNTIAMLKTGAGKTMISLMLIRHIGKDIAASGKKQLILFLAPTVHLVHQQYEQITIHTDFDVGLYHGSKGVDEWTAECWAKEISKHQIMVMTPQILLDALRNAFLSLKMIRFIIFDECHRATGNHPYARIMKEFYHKSVRKPRIFGMTASPVTRKGVSSVIDCENQMGELESILNSKIYTLADNTELETLVPSAKESKRYYEPMVPLYDGLTAQLEILWARFDNSIDQLQQSSSKKFKDSENELIVSRKRLSSSYMKISNCIKTLGPFCAREAAKVCLQNMQAPHDIVGGGDIKDGNLLCHSFLEEVLFAIENVLPQGLETLLKTERGCLEAVDKGYISPKLYELIQIFKSFGTTEQVLCLVFVERKIAVKVIQKLVKNLSFLSHLEASYLTGGSSSVDALTLKMQRDTLDLFRCGKVNLLLTTDVAEEGLHIPDCSCVVHFDLPKTIRSYVQSRGRARRADSQYIIMLEKGNTQQENLLSHITQSEIAMKETAVNSDPNTSVSIFGCKEDAYVYNIESTGATVSADSSITLINKYCGKLPKDKYFNPGPEFLISDLHGGSFRCRLTLPPSAVFRVLDGPICQNSRLAKQLVCLEACKKLHEMGVLNDYLLPFGDEPVKPIPIVKEGERHTGAGTTKRKELHGSVSIHSLAGSWAHRDGDVILQAYHINFSCDKAGQKYSSFALLLEANLDDDVGHLDLDLFLVDKIVRSSVRPRGSIILDPEKIAKAKVFQQFFFNGLFGKLFSGSRSAGKQMEFLFNSSSCQSWNNRYIYLLLPLSGDGCADMNINWEAVNACVSVVGYLQSVYLQTAFYSARSILPHVPKSCSITGTTNMPDSIHLANKLVSLHELESMVVLAKHTGKIYTVLGVKVNTCAHTPFEDNSSDFSTYIDYFDKKYGIGLQHPCQPLLLLKHSHNPHNLLSSKARYEGSLQSSKVISRKPQTHAHMPPELLVPVDVAVDVLKSFYLFPSLMHRLESLMLATQLRHEIPVTHCNVPSILILEALTTLRCCEDFSLERLELLGDSVLKYAVSSALFLKFPNNHEGQLSASRSHAVCNATLHKLGIDRNIQGYVRDAAFEPRRWVAPGQISLYPVCCKCEVKGSENPLNIKFVTEEKSIVIGKACDSGHRWICSKTISDSVEALIGAYYVGGGLRAALSLMTWLGMDVEFDMSLLEENIRVASLRSYLPKIDEIEALESKLSYSFNTKGLLLEATTHASYQGLVSYCYQRLEFLGDAVLDLLITHHLFKCYPDTDPGELTDLRSASVCNENFAKVAVKHKLHCYLQHGSAFLLEQISDFVKSFGESLASDSLGKANSSATSPKALGDLVESIAGAMLIDTEFNFDLVWQKFEVLLSPFPTPQDLELPPFRKLNEMCSHLGYFLNVNCTSDGEKIVAKLSVQLEDAFLEGNGRENCSRAAKGQAAALLLAKMEDRGLSHSRYPMKRKQESLPAKDTSSDILVHENPTCGNYDLSRVVNKRQKTFGADVSEQTLISQCTGVIASDSGRSVVFDNLALGSGSSDLTLTAKSVAGSASDSYRPEVLDNESSVPVLSVKMQKGGPRTTLYELCRKLQWPMPSFQATEVSSNVGSGLGATEIKKGINRFKSKITLCIPNVSSIELTGEERFDKKSSNDSAALVILYELQKLGRCRINEL